MTSAERLAIEIVVILALIGGFALYERHKGAQACIQADQAAVAKQEAHNEAKGESDAKTINDEAKTFKNVVSAPDPIDAPHVSLCHYTPSAVPSSSTSRSLPDASPPSRVQDQAPPRDVGPPLVKVGQDSDAQVLGLQDYITRVCLVK